ncbi:MAG TPA: beta-ketoacyl-ACP synthase III [Lacipirellulaceae bacterium]|nr:beta-ketoacyl-ACP synthase III [Lacipirellulaceae bacterium]
MRALRSSITSRTENSQKPAATVRRTRPATILGTGICVPERAIDNDYFRRELGVDTTPEWIESRIGILNRYWAADETSTDLAVGAARSALQHAKLRAEDVDLIVVATSSPDFTMPSTACLVQHRIGAPDALAFDVVNACSGFVYALDAATRYLQGGEFKNALVVGADRGSRLIDPADRSTSVFFGDGAGAAVVGAHGRGRVLASKMHSRGTSRPLFVPVGGTIKMDGPAIWNFAVEVLPQTVRELCDLASVAIDDIKLIVPHQANRNILAASAEALGLPLDRIAINIDRYGNTLAGSIPIALDEVLANDRVRPGDIIAMVGFGAGLAWGGLLLQI